MSEIKVLSDVTGTAWKIIVAVGQSVEEGDELMIAEAMKMEIPHSAPSSGVIKEICVEDGQPVEYDQVLIILE